MTAEACAVRSNDVDALLATGVPIARGIARGFCRRRPDWRDDFESEALETAWHAAESYDAELGPWTAWVRYTVKSYLREVFRRLCRRDTPRALVRDADGEQVDNLDELPAKLEPSYVIGEGLLRALWRLRPRERQVIELRYLRFGGVPQFEVAAMLGVSRQRAQVIEKQALGKLRQALTS